jgi:hypothetical protein
MRLTTTFEKLAAKFAIDFKQLAAEIEHRGEAGAARESALHHLLGGFLPGRAAVGSGFVVDAAGGQSRQMDIVIYDRVYSTIFPVLDAHFYPCETVLAVGQIKTAITSVDRLTDALDNVASAKSLDRSNHGKNRPITGPGYSTPNLGKPFEPQKNHRDQILGFVFTGASLRKETVIAEIQNWQKSNPRSVWPNLYCDFNSFLISYFSDELTTSAMDARGMYCTKPGERENVLLILLVLLATFVNEARIARPDYFAYSSIATTEHDSYVLGV